MRFSNLPCRTSLNRSEITGPLQSPFTRQAQAGSVRLRQAGSIIRCNLAGDQQLGRRQALGAALTAASLLACVPHVSAARGLGRYVREKQLDALETYVPQVLLAREQFQVVGDIGGGVFPLQLFGALCSTTKELLLCAGQDPTKGRALLRSQAFEGLRESVKAVAAYAERDERVSADGRAALVADVFKSVEQLDYELFQAKRTGQPVSQEAAQAALGAGLAAMDRLLATVPPEALGAARAVAEGARDTTQEPASAQNAAGALQKLLPQ